MSQEKKNKPENKPENKPKKAKLGKGVEIRCPRKKHLIGTIKQALNGGEVISAAKIKFEIGQERVAGELAVCKICGSVYFEQGKIYTQDGWQPNEPNLEPVTFKNMRK